MLLQSKWVYLNPINQGVAVPSEYPILLQDKGGRTSTRNTTFVTWGGISPDAPAMKIQPFVLLMILQREQENPS